MYYFYEIIFMDQLKKHTFIQSKNGKIIYYENNIPNIFSVDITHST